jgi:hypothetical protein
MNKSKDIRMGLYSDGTGQPSDVAHCLSGQTGMSVTGTHCAALNAG